MPDTRQPEATGKPIARRAKATSHPDRDAQFMHLNESCASRTDAGRAGDLGRYEEEGACRRLQERRPRHGVRKGEPEDVRVHDFLIKELGRAVPYGIYDLAANAGWVSVGMEHDTAAFAVQTIRRWWHEVGRGSLSARQAAGHHCGWRRQQWLALAVCGNANCSVLPVNWISTSSCSAAAATSLTGRLVRVVLIRNQQGLCLVALQQSRLLRLGHQPPRDPQQILQARDLLLGIDRA